MTKFESLTKQFDAALARMDEILKEQKTAIVRDAALKRFEFTFDLAWKTIRAFLQEKKGVDCVSPKDCIRAAYRQGLIEYEDVWLQIPDWRNQSVPVYSEKHADILYEKLPQVTAFFQKLSSALKENTTEK